MKHDIRWFLLFWFIVFFLMGAFWGFALCRTVDAQEWNWSPSAVHHDAVCRVTSGDGGGSGVVVQCGNLRGVLTVAHMMSGSETTIEFSDGSKSRVSGKNYTTDKHGHDLAFLFTDTPKSITPVFVSEQGPVVGDRVELMTTGGPEHRLRSFWATVKSVSSNTTEYDCDVLAGDSGGGILNTSGRLVGIQSYGLPPRIAGQTNWLAYHGSGSASYRPVRDFLRRVAEKCELENDCPQPEARQHRGDSRFYPPRSKPPNEAGRVWRAATPGKPAAVAEPARESPNSRTPVPPYKASLPAIDYEKLAEAVLLKIDLSKIRGPAGPQGKPGATGQSGQQGPAGLASKHDIDAIANAVKEKISGSIRIKVTPIVK